MKSKKEKQLTPRETVLDWFDTAIKTGGVFINTWYSPNLHAWRELVKDGTIKKRKVGRIFVGYEYRGYLFNTREGHGDCVEILSCDGKI